MTTVLDEGAGHVNVVMSEVVETQLRGEGKGIGNSSILCMHSVYIALFTVHDQIIAN